jgi:2-succinyl-6-hydroxy-2,4-cyclohexadiene-1-carboxylate synthase
VHGFTQSGRSWAPIVHLLAGSHEVVTVDVPGHGGSSRVRAGLTEGAELLGETAGRAAYVGYSLGGRLCLHLALVAPELVERLVLVSTSPGIGDSGERASRSRADEALAGRLDGSTSGGGAPPLDVGAFLDEWLSGPLFAHLSQEAAGRAARLENTPAGLAASLRLMGAGTQQPLWGRLRELTMPVLLVAGATDRRYAALAAESAAAIAAGGGGRRVAVEIVAGAGHAVPFEEPDAFVRVLLEFLASSGEAPAAN